MVRHSIYFLDSENKFRHLLLNAGKQSAFSCDDVCLIYPFAFAYCGLTSDPTPFSHMYTYVYVYMRFLWAEGRGRVALPGQFITIAFHVPGTWHSSAACQHICTWIAGERVAVYMEIFTFTYICMHWKCSKKKKENKKWRRDTKVGGDGGVFRSKAALYENGNGMGKSWGKAGELRPTDGNQFAGCRK